MDKEYLTIEEASGFIGYARSYLYKLSRCGVLASFKPRGKLLFRRSDLEAFLARGRRAASYELTESADAVLNALPRGRK